MHMLVSFPDLRVSGSAADDIGRNERGRAIAVPICNSVTIAYYYPTSFPGKENAEFGSQFRDDIRLIAIRAALAPLSWG